jgi:hypothetical protein
MSYPLLDYPEAMTRARPVRTLMSSILERMIPSIILRLDVETLQDNQEADMTSAPLRLISKFFVVFSSQLPGTWSSTAGRSSPKLMGFGPS